MANLKSNQTTPAASVNDSLEAVSSLDPAVDTLLAEIAITRCDLRTGGSLVSATIISLPTAAKEKVVQNKRSGRLPREVGRLDRQRWLYQESLIAAALARERVERIEGLQFELRSHQRCVAEVQYLLAKEVHS